jgi:hypothetical protein
MSTLSLVAGCQRLVVVRLLAADRGAWCCMAIVRAVRDCVIGRRLWHQQLVLTWSVANHGELFQHGCIHLVRYIVGGRRRRHPQFSGLIAGASGVGMDNELMSS